MSPYFLVGVIVLLAILLAARGFVQASPAQLAQGLRAFLAAFSALASTGLLFTGRFGLALVAIGATFMAIRAMSRAHAGASGSFGGPSAGQRSSEVKTETLNMQLDHRTGELEGEVLRGRFAGRSLASLGVSDLLELLADCQREDPRSVPLLETYLDRRAPDWRGDVGGAGAGAGERSTGPGPQSAMDEATAWSILGLAPGASEAEIKAAHRRLMTKLHPDHGGSGYLAAQLNQAKDYLLSRHR
jgi:DnaJ domain